MEELKAKNIIENLESIAAEKGADALTGEIIEECCRTNGEDPEDFKNFICENIDGMSTKMVNDAIYQRYVSHLDFVKERESLGKEVKYYNDVLECKVMTSQETDMNFHYLQSISKYQNGTVGYECIYYDDISVCDYDSIRQDSLFYKLAK